MKQDQFVKYLETGKIPVKPIRTIPGKAQAYVKKQSKRFGRLKDKPYWLDDNFTLKDGKYVPRKGMGLGPKELSMDLQADNLMDKAKNASNEVYALSDKYAKKFGGVSTPVNLKSKESILRKTKAECGGDIFQIKDSVRTTIVVSKERVNDVYNAMSADSTFVRIKKQTPDKYMGYQDVITNIKTSQGILGEIQVNSPEMIFAKQDPKSAKEILGIKKWNQIKKSVGVEGGLGHKYYEEYRDLNPKIPSEDLRRQELVKLSSQYYSLFR
jgi:hypothetical protein